MMGHKICFYGEIWLIISKLSLLPLLIWSTDICANVNGAHKLCFQSTETVCKQYKPCIDLGLMLTYIEIV